MKSYWKTEKPVVQNYIPKTTNSIEYKGIYNLEKCCTILVLSMCDNKLEEAPYYSSSLFLTPIMREKVSVCQSHFNIS